MGLDQPAGERPASRAVQVAETLRQMICNNDLAPGSSFLETELGEMLGVSRTPIREAAVILEGRGLVEIVPRRGIRIATLTITDMEEIYDILIELEPFAAARAAALGHGDEELAPVRRCLTEMEDALEQGDRARWAEWDGRFHSGLVALSGNGRLVEIVSMYSDQVHRARLLTLHMRPEPHASNRCHRALVDAIARGAVDEARTLHRDHRVEARSVLIELLKRHSLTRI
ncbi:MAG: GntR family transcriptional regulator [Pseudomonadota bacterium]